MKLMEKIKNSDYNIISIVGLAKNAGKTVTLNYLIEEARKNDIKIGITSTGRDGESIDLVTNTQKPSIYVTDGTLAATAKNALMLSTAKVEILETTGINTPMGEVIIVRVRQSGNIQIAGPVKTSDMKTVCQKLRDFGAEKVFVDGAVDRKAASSPIVTDACIVATGAVLSRDMKKVVERTAHTVQCYRLPQVEDKVKNILLSSNLTCVMQNTGQIIFPNVKIGITGGKKLAEITNEDTAYIYVKGAVTSNFLKDICQNKYIKQFEVVIEDGTKLFAEIDVWNNLRRKGLKIAVLNEIKIIALTLNPVSPTGYFFDSDEFLGGISQCLNDIKIIDVVSGGERN